MRDIDSLVVVAAIVAAILSSNANGATIQIVEDIQIIDRTPTRSPVSVPPPTTPTATNKGEVVRAVDKSKIAVVSDSGKANGDAVDQIAIRDDFKYSTSSVVARSPSIVLLVSTLLVAFAKAGYR